MKRIDWQDEEIFLLSVGPVPFGLLGPLFSLALALFLFVTGMRYVSLVKEHAMIFGAILLLPTSFVVATRAWRWKSHRVVITSMRVVVRSGVLRRRLVTVYYDRLLGVHSQRRVRDRLVRQGGVTLETDEGPMYLGRFRHPDSLIRMIQHQRDAFARDSIPLDTTFDFEMPSPYAPKVIRRRAHRRGDHE